MSGAVVAALTMVPVTAASAAVPSAATTCTGDYFPYHVVSSVDWLKVHRSPDHKTTDVLGQIARNHVFCVNELRQVGNTFYDHGYGYNGSVRLTGWVDDGYLALGPG